MTLAKVASAACDYDEARTEEQCHQADRGDGAG